MFPFRTEVTSRRSEKLSGEASIFVPFGWHVVGLTLFLAFGAAIVFLSVANYSKIETVPGVIAPDRGVAAVMPSRPGTITKINVEEGQLVPAGAPLVSVQAEEFLPRGGSTGSAMEAAMSLQDASLQIQSQSARRAAQSDLRQNAAQQAGLKAEMTQLRSQIGFQRRLVESSQVDLKHISEVAARGFISGQEVRGRQDSLIVRQQQLAQLEQQLGERSSTLAQAQRNAAKIEADGQGATANLAATRAQLAQQAASVRASRAYLLRAPLAGRVADLTARVGQPANVQQQLMNIVPDDGVLRAELAVPSEAIGFIRRGQEVRLAIDSFPYQKFGTLTGRVRTVAGSAVTKSGPGGTELRVYPVTVDIRDTAENLGLRRTSLLPGMTLSARIVTSRESFIHWLFQPLFAVRGR